MQKNISNNFFNGEVIVSYDCNKIWKETIDNRIIFCKKTTYNEVKNIKKMSKLLQDKNININNHKYKLKIPNIYKWDNDKNIIFMEYYKGKNLEFYLRNKETYNEGQLIYNEVLKFLIENKIYWLDFAARNIIVGKNVICFVDYEKGFEKKNINAKNYLRNHVYEEYCVFLFLKDRKYSYTKILELKNEKNTILYLDEIKCKRICEIAKFLGYKETITKKEYLSILKMLIIAQEPKIINNKFYFPCVELDKIFAKEKKEVALKKYCKEIICLYKNNIKYSN